MKVLNDLDLNNNNIHNVANLNNGASIDDNDVSTEKTWSSNKLSIPIEWVKNKMQAELYDTALSLYDISTSASNTSYYTDVQASTEMVVTATITFDGQNVDADETPDGWTRVSEGVYTNTLDSSSGRVSAQEFTYTPNGGVYDGIELTKSSQQKSITAINPVYWGMATSDVYSDLEEQISNLTRVTSNVSQSVSIVNPHQESAYLWILTKNSASATQLGFSILNEPTNNVSFTSTENPSITMEGYRLYISNKSAGAEMSFDNVELTINR